MKKDIARNVVGMDATMRDVMTVLNSGVFGVAFVVDGAGRLAGLFTDGDVRRALIGGAGLESPAADHMQRDFTYARESMSHEERVRLLAERIRHLPVLDDDGRLVDFLSWAEMWRLPVMEPTLGGNEMKYVSDCIATNWISSQGSYVRAFEGEFAAWHGGGQALTVTNGTTALHLALTAMGVGPGDEVVVPDLTFGACANAVLHTGADPVFCDVSPDTWNLDPARLPGVVTPRTKVIMAVHLYGHPCDMDPILEFARPRGILVLEDCAEALGARYRGVPVGTLGDAACFSFFSNKVITTGEGGMVLTASAKLADSMRVLRDHGMRPERRYWHEVAGFNYRMTNLQAAVGLAQLEQVDRFLARRAEMAQAYRAGLAGVAGLTLPPDKDWAVNVHWLFSVLVERGRDAVLGHLESQGVETRPLFPPLHGQPAFARGGEFPVTEDLSRRGLSLPSGNGISAEQIERVRRALEKSIRLAGGEPGGLNAVETS